MHVIFTISGISLFAWKFSPRIVDGSSTLDLEALIPNGRLRALGHPSKVRFHCAVRHMRNAIVFLNFKVIEVVSDDIQYLDDPFPGRALIGNPNVSTVVS